MEELIEKLNKMGFKVEFGADAWPEVGINGGRIRIHIYPPDHQRFIDGWNLGYYAEQNPNESLKDTLVRAADQAAKHYRMKVSAAEERIKALEEEVDLNHEMELFLKEILSP